MKKSDIKVEWVYTNDNRGLRLVIADSSQYPILQRTQNKDKDCVAYMIVNSSLRGFPNWPPNFPYSFCTRRHFAKWAKRCTPFAAFKQELNQPTTNPINTSLGEITVDSASKRRTRARQS